MAVLAAVGVEAPVALSVAHAFQDHLTLVAGVLGDEHQRCAKGFADHPHTQGLFGFKGFFQIIQHVSGPHQCDSTAGDDALFDGGPCRGKGVFSPGFALVDLGLGGAADLEHRHAAHQGGHALLELFTVVVRAGLFYLDAQLFQPVLDGLVVAPAVDDGGIVFIGDQPAGRPKEGNLGVFDL